MAGLLDSLLLNLDRQTAPEQRPFSLQNFMTDAGQMGNVLAKNEERQRQNSLRRLIEQRESEGFGYDQLSNEAAKYDMDAANAMRREFRDSYQFNQKQSDIELQRYKREMADYWFGEVLRRAQVAGLGPAELKEVCFEAAGLIAPYDSDLAYKLLRDSEMAQASEMKRAADAAKRNKKPDETKKIDDIRQKNMAINPDFDKDPSQTRENRIRGLAADAVLRWKGKGNPDSENYAHWSGYDRAVWIPMVNSLYQAAFEKFPNLYKNSGSYRDADRWLRGLSEDEIYNIIGGQTIQPENDENYEEIPQKTPQVRNGTGKSAPVGVDSQEGVKLPKTLLAWSGDNTAKRVNSKAVGELYAAIPNLITEKDFAKAAELASELNEMESGEGSSYSKIQAAIDKRRADIEKEIDLLKEMGVRNPEKQFEDFRKIFGTRASMGFIRQINNLNSFVDGYYSNSPMTVMVNGLLFGEPNYKPTADEFYQAKQIHGNTWQNIKTQVANLKIPVMSKIADFDNQQQALYATGRAVQRQAKSLWQGLTKGMSEEEKAKMDMYLRNNLRIGDDAMDILKGKARLAFNDEEYNRIRDNLNKVDESGDLRLIGGGSEGSNNGGNGSMSDDDILGRF